MPNPESDRTALLKGVGAPIVTLAVAILIAGGVVVLIGDRTVSSLMLLA